MEENDTLSIDGRNLSLFIGNEEIMNRVENVANRLFEDLGDVNPLFLCVLKGSLMFTADFMRAYKGRCEVSFVRISSYEGTESTGKAKTVMGLTDELRGRYIVVLEDIVDTGHTMHYLLGQIEAFQPKGVRLVSLFVKPSKLAATVKVDYHCFEIPDRFIVGYGLDYNEQYRNLPDIYAL